MANASENGRSGVTYRDAGVDIDAGNALVEAIKPLASSTRRAGADVNLGGFGGLFDLSRIGYRDPILVAANDGVGTKLKIAIDTGRHDTVGIDLVAMCVNDLVVQGAEPLFFLDYIAAGQLDVAQATSIISGIAEGCKQAGCALIGGETAEMPGLYAGSDYDLAGFAVGAVERDALLPRGDMKDGDVLIGLASSGPHANGYSLIRKLVGREGLAYDKPAPFDSDRTLGEALLAPTRVYVRAILELIRADVGIKAVAHITGGGLTENIPRVLAKGLDAKIDLGSWRTPEVFGWLQKAGDIADAELLRTFNCGIGMVVICEAERTADAFDILAKQDFAARQIGSIKPGQSERSMVIFDGNLDFAQ